MPRSNKPPPAWAQSVARCTWVRFFPNSARTTRRSPRVPWARTDLRASTAGKNRVQIACRPQREESRMQKEKDSDQDPEVNQPVFLSLRTQSWEGTHHSLNEACLSSFHSLAVPKLCLAWPSCHLLSSLVLQPQGLPCPYLSGPLHQSPNVMGWTISPSNSCWGPPPPQNLLMWVYLECVYVYVCVCYYFFFLAASHGTWDLISLTRD